MKVFEFRPSEYKIQEKSQIQHAIIDLKNLNDKNVLKKVLEVCGELTLAFDLTCERFYLLDYGKGDGTSNIESIQKGLAKMISELEGQINPA